MLARLALLLQERTVEGANILTIELLDSNGELVKDLYKESLNKAFSMNVPNWTDDRKAAQVHELVQVRKSITFDGYEGFKLREEGGFKALPPENSRERWGLLPEHTPNERGLLKNLPALREYCIPVHQSLVLTYAACKTTDAWQDCPNASPFGNKTRIILAAIDNAIQNGDISFANGLVDVNNSFEFQIPDDV